jgi:hypothetical protein
MLAHRFNRFQQIAGGIGFHNIPASPSIEGLPHHLRRVMLSNKKNFKAGGLLPPLNQAAGLQSVHPGHGDVENDHVGLEGIDFIQRLKSVRSFAHNFPSGSTF